ncbi:pulmonary surfactant-associated protein D-like [Drosophila teissieri]|uniref:pulmonary surfactant-associated protein D-like n=1 Tax=Drosophila teissieri TaxID=7243 RepID=UPI001CB9FC59|nr:pulmonary surfactant-associated protein D-like [Drosophila teissieri]
MFRLHIGFLCLVIAFCILFGVSHATSDSICVLSNAPQQCGAFCLAALHPLYDQYSKSRQQEHSQEAIVKIIADFRAEQKEAMVKLIADFRADQKELFNVLASNLTASRLESILQSRPVTVPPGFQKIGSRYFFIEYNKGKSWSDAEETCREKGGHLAAFRTEDELEAITRIVHKYTSFWLGYHRNSEDGFVTATGNKGSFMKWGSEEPTNIGGNEHCVVLFNSCMYYGKCDITIPFICQLDTV